MRKPYLRFFILAFFVFLLDQATKILIVKHLSLYQVIRIFPSFNIVYYRNIGSAFGLFKTLGNPFFIVISLIAIAGVAFLIIKDRGGRLGFSLILAGAAGNLADRLAHGYVVDFIEVYAGNFYWPAFNVADSALTIGIALLIVKTVIGRE
ncbi:MAG: signal peptidase II [Nitrospiraceae bacterium]|nr:signal peptidase II [Nitrospiraceae bacterium]